MPRKRMIDPEFWSDEVIGLWSFEARLFYIGLWNFADDEGRFKAHDKLLKAQIFPYNEKIVIHKLKKEIGSKIQWYIHEDAQYGYIRNFLRYQRIDRPTESKLPSPGTLDDTSTNPQRDVPPKIREVNISKDNITTMQQIIDKWNQKMPLKAKGLSDKRREHLCKRLREQLFIDNIDIIIDKIKNNDFLLGRAPSPDHPNFKADFDWIIKNNSNYLKVLEGKYDKKRGRGDV